jgi:2-dehydro-3-deoxygluconokinase
MRSSKIVYNRFHSSFAHIEPDSVDWERILYCCDCLHWTGISPAISEGAYQTLKKGLEVAQKKGITITADPAYRCNLWQYGRKGKEVLAELVDVSTIFIGGVNEINEILNSDFGYDKRGFISASRALRNSHPSIEKVFDKVRTGISASWQRHMVGRKGGKFIRTDELKITFVVNRIGSGDAYAAGFIYGLQNLDD